MYVFNTEILTDARSMADRWDLAQSEIDRSCEGMDKASELFYTANEKIGRVLGHTYITNTSNASISVIRTCTYVMDRARGDYDNEAKINAQCWDVISEIRGAENDCS